MTICCLYGDTGKNRATMGNKIRSIEKLCLLMYYANSRKKSHPPTPSAPSASAASAQLPTCVIFDLFSARGGVLIARLRSQRARGGPQPNEKNRLDWAALSRFKRLIEKQNMPGAGEWTRTTDLRITNALLCQLSYTGQAAPIIIIKFAADNWETARLAAPSVCRVSAPGSPRQSRPRPPRLSAIPLPPVPADTATRRR